MIHDKFGIIEGLMTTVHATTATQKTVDGPSAKDWRGGRCRQHHPLLDRGSQSSRQGDTGAQRQAYRHVVPCSHPRRFGSRPHRRLEKAATYDEIKAEVKRASRTNSRASSVYRRVRSYRRISSAMRAPPSSTPMRVSPSTATSMKLVSWYDNEWGYSNKVVELIKYMATVICTFGEEPYTLRHYPSAQATLSPTGERAFAIRGVSFSASRRTSGPVPGAAPLQATFPPLATAAPHTNGETSQSRPPLPFPEPHSHPGQEKGSSLLHSVADGRRVRLTARPDHAKKHPEFPYSEKGVFLREMRHLGNNRFAKTVLLLCVLMQAVALMPHHHHGDLTAVCLNYSHINGANPCRNVCTGTGSHTQPYASCASHSLTVAQPQPREEGLEEAVAAHSPECGCLSVRRSAELSSSIISRRSPCRASATLPVPNPISGFSSRPRYRAAPPDFMC